MTRKTFIIVCLCVSFLMGFSEAYAQEQQPLPEIESALLIELGGSVWGAGAALEFQSRKSAIFAGIGMGYYEGAPVFYAGGLKYYFSPLPKGSFYIGAAYGKTAYYEETLTTIYGVEEKSKDFYGPSAIAGYRWLFGQSKRVGLCLGGAAVYTPDLPEWAKEEIEEWQFVPVVHLDFRLY